MGPARPGEPPSRRGPWAPRPAVDVVPGAMARRASPPSPRDQRRDHHEQLSRGQLLDAAEHVFGQKGFHETTLKEVADRAEFSVGSVYSFFAGKDELFRQVLIRRGGEFLEEMRTVASSGTSVDQLHRLVDMQVQFFRRHVDFGRLVLRDFTVAAITSEGLRAGDVVDANFSEATRIQVELFTHGQRDGVLRPGDPRLHSRLLSGLVLSFQSVDPAVGDGADGTEEGTGAPHHPDGPIPAPETTLASTWLEDLHAVVGRAFVV
jgi:TetR/AcrR family transcriptional regulator